MSIKPSPYARRQNQIRQQQPDVIEFRLREADRYKNYERHVLARNYNASATPRYMEHFSHAPHKLHMVSSCIEQVTRAVENIQQQQLARAEAGRGLANPLTTTGRGGGGATTTNDDHSNNSNGNATSYTLEQNMKGLGSNAANGGGSPPGSSSSSRFRGPSTTAKLFLPDGAESFGETMNPDYKHHMEDHQRETEQEREDVVAAATGDVVEDDDNQRRRNDHYNNNNNNSRNSPRKRTLTASEIVSGRRSSVSPTNARGNSPIPHSPTSSSSPTSRRGGRKGTGGGGSPNNNGNDSQGGFFSNFDDPTRKFRFRPVELAEALADPPIHPLPRPPLFSRPCKGQTVIVGGDIRLVGRNANSKADALTEPKATAHSTVARDPKMIAVRIAVEQNPLHEAIEQMRQVTAAMAVKTYNAVNAMNTIMKSKEREEHEMMMREQNQYLPSLQRQGGINNNNKNNNNNGSSSARSTISSASASQAQTPRSNLANSARGKRLTNPTSLSQNYRKQQIQLNNSQDGGSARPPSRPMQLNNFNQQQQQQQQQRTSPNALNKPTTPQRQRKAEDGLIYAGKHLGDETIVASKPPTRESRIVPNASVATGSIRPTSGRNTDDTSHFKVVASPSSSHDQQQQQQQQQQPNSSTAASMIPSPPSRRVKLGSGGAKRKITSADKKRSTDNKKEKNDEEAANGSTENKTQKEEEEQKEIQPNEEEQQQQEQEVVEQTTDENTQEEGEEQEGQLHATEEENEPDSADKEEEEEGAKEEETNDQPEDVEQEQEQQQEEDKDEEQS